MQTPIPKNGPVSLKEVWDEFFNEAAPRASDYELNRREYGELGIMSQYGSDKPSMQRLLGKAVAMNKQNVTTNRNEGYKRGNTWLQLYSNPPSPTYGMDGGVSGLRDPWGCYRVKMMGGYVGIRSAMLLNTKFEVKEADGGFSPVTAMRYSVELQATTVSGDTGAQCYLAVVGYSDPALSRDPIVCIDTDLVRSTSGHQVVTGTFNTAPNRRYYVCSLQRNNKPDSSTANEYSARWSSLEIARV